MKGNKKGGGQGKIKNKTKRLALKTIMNQGETNQKERGTENKKREIRKKWA